MATHRAVVSVPPPDFARVRFRDVLRIRTFAVLFAAEMQSLVGDQLARVALSVLAYDRTHSAVVAAGTYAATMLPAVFGGLVLSRIADRVPRRLVMVCVALLGAACFGAMAIPGMPLPLVIVLLVIAVAVAPLFSAAEVSQLSLSLPPAQYRVATAARMTGSQVAQISGFALGGVLVAATGARTSLLIDAATFVLSAVLIATLLRDGTRRVARVPPPSAAVPVTAPPEFRGLWRTPRLRLLLLMGGLIGLFVVPEGLAVPFGQRIGASTADIGLLLCSAALGGAIGSVLVVRLIPPEYRMTGARLMAVACGLPLIPIVVVAHWPVAALCWMASGIFAAYIVEVTSLLVQAVPAARRAYYTGVVNTVLLVSQGLGMLGFGAVSAVVSPGAAITAAGAVGSALALLLALATRGRRRVGAHSPGVRERSPRRAPSFDLR